MPSIYTKEELILKIKAIDTKLEKAIEESELDTTQNRQTFEIAVDELRKQRDYYLVELGRIEQGLNKSGLVSLVRCPTRRGFR